MSTDAASRGTQDSATIALLRTLAALGPRLHEPATAATPEALFTVVGDTLRSCGLFAHIAMLDADDQLRIAATSLEPAALREMDHLLGTTLLGYVIPAVWPFDTALATGEAISIADFAAVFAPLVPHLSAHAAAELARVAGAEHAIVAPIMAHDRSIGALTVWGPLTHLSAEDAPAVAALAAQMGIALENARLFGSVDAERAQWHATVDSMGDFVITADAAGRLTHFNAAFVRCFGDRPVPLLAPETIPDTYGPRHPDGSTIALGELPIYRALRTGQPDPDVPVLMRTSAGIERHTIWTTTPIRGTDGALLGAIAVGRDVTRQRRLERQNRAALRVLLRIAATVTDPALRSDPAVLLPRVTEALAQLEAVDQAHTMLIDEDSGRLIPLTYVGVSADEEAVWKDIVAHADLSRMPRIEEAHATLRAGRLFTQNFDLEEPIVSPKVARALHIRSAISAPIFVDGHLTGLLTIGRTRPLEPDETTAFAPWDEEFMAGVAHLTSEALDRARLAQRLTEAEAARLAAEEATRQRDEFLSIASHELKTPLTSLKTYAQAANRRVARLLAGHSVADLPTLMALLTSMGQTLDRVDRQADRLHLLVNDLIDVARIESGKLRMRPSECDLVAICRQCAEDQSRVAERPITTRLPDHPMTLVADPDRISQVVINLLSNALKYSPSDQPVTLVARQTDDAVVVSVRDRGPGLPTEEHERIFERFHRVPGVQVQSGSGVGLGLGLSISREIVARHGGRIWVESRPGFGATFSFSLPLTPAFATASS
jgi:signal transduction histidine kinase